MKFKYLFFLFLMSTILVACTDDEDPIYEWRTLWINQMLDVNGIVLRTDTVFDGLQSMSDEDAKIIIRGEASSFMLSNIDEDIIQTEGDVKSRTILYSNKSRRLIFSNTKVK